MERIQRKCAKGYRIPKTAKYVGRPTKWGNPFKVVKKIGYLGYLVWMIQFKDDYNCGDFFGYKYKKDAIERAVKEYDSWLSFQIRNKKIDLTELKGFDLACFCPLSSPCHVDVLLKRVNENC